METKAALLDEAKNILESNSHGDWTQPTKGLYPHQWLWDSCFIAIGYSTYDIDRAERELVSVFRGQWDNGMLPHIIFSEARKYSYGPEFWGSKKSSSKLKTSGMTQPPMPAIAAVEIGKRMEGGRRVRFFKKIYSSILAYHEWIYRDRDPEGSGLTVLLHPWETGLDNTPPWMEVMKKVQTKETEFKRVDTDFVSPKERPTEEEHRKLVSLALLHRKLGYESSKIIEESPVVVQDLLFNSVLIAANDALIGISKELDEQIPDWLFASFHKTKVAMSRLWDEQTGQFYSRDFKSGKLLKMSTSSTFMPLFADFLDYKYKEKLLSLLFDRGKYWTKYPVPTVPVDSICFKERCYWQGPVWANMNWFILKALEKECLEGEAGYLFEQTLKLVYRSGFREYYSTFDGSGCGGKNFSWTAALMMDLAFRIPVGAGSIK